MYESAKALHPWLAPLLLLNSLALIALAAHAVVQIRSDEPMVVKIDQYTDGFTTPPAEASGHYTNLLSYDTRIQYLDIYAALAAGTLMALHAWASFFSDRQRKLQAGHFTPVDLKGSNRERQQVGNIIFLDSVFFPSTLVLTLTVWTLHNDAEQVLDMHSPLLPEHYVNMTIKYEPTSKDKYFTFETWNCALVSSVSFDHGSYPPRAVIHDRCVQLDVLRHLNLPLVVISSIRAAISSWMYRDAVIKASMADEDAANPLLHPERETNHITSEHHSLQKS